MEIKIFIKIQYLTYIIDRARKGQILDKYRSLIALVAIVIFHRRNGFLLWLGFFRLWFGHLFQGNLFDGFFIRARTVFVISFRYIKGCAANPDDENRLKPSESAALYRLKVCLNQ